MNFQPFATAVAERFDYLQRNGKLLRVNIGGDDLWDAYLGAFTPEQNPLFRKRTEHDCSCCRGFVKQAGGLVAIIDGQVESIWKVQAPGYQNVADLLDQFVSTATIADVFFHEGSSLGVAKSFEQLAEGVQTWNHFHVTVPREYQKKRCDIPTALAGPRTKVQTLKRAVEEITDEAISTVLDLIGQNALARGDQYRRMVEAFKATKAAFKDLGAFRDASTLAWWMIASGAVGDDIAGIRNTAIGTLLVDLSEDRDLEPAVRSFEVKVAGDNYKRPSALITLRMIAEAKATVEELGLTSALERRHARLGDITANNILFVDRATRSRLKDSPFDDLAPTAPAPTQSMDRVDEIPIEKFLADVLPNISSIEIGLERKHAAAKVALITATDPTAGRLFKWDNPFSWSYEGNFADAVKARVKAAGGNVDGDVCCRLAWSNHDDLDFHAVEPGGYEIFYGTKGRASPMGGTLDVDMNAGSGQTREPVENIVWADRSRMRAGVYKLFVHQFARRESHDVGFTVDIDVLGEVYHFEYPKTVSGSVPVAELIVSPRGEIQVVPKLPHTTTSALPAEFAQVSTIMLSPNCWDGRQVGQRHYFFMVDGWRMEEPPRGFYNEQLLDALTPHRKVFEVLGSKMKVPEASEQLVGLGFSASGKDNALVARVKGAFTRTIKIVF